MWRKGNHLALLVGMQTGAATVVSSMGIPQKIKNGSAFWPSYPTSGNISQNPKTLIWKDISTLMFIAALFTIYKIWKQPKCPSMDEWIKQLWVLQYGILLGYKKEESFTFCENMDGPGEHYAKRNEAVRERQISHWFHSYGESNEQTELTSKIETDS